MLLSSTVPVKDSQITTRRTRGCTFDFDSAKLDESTRDESKLFANSCWSSWLIAVIPFQLRRKEKETQVYIAIGNLVDGSLRKLKIVCLSDKLLSPTFTIDLSSLTTLCNLRVGGSIRSRQNRSLLLCHMENVPMTASASLAGNEKTLVVWKLSASDVLTDHNALSDVRMDRHRCLEFNQCLFVSNYRLCPAMQSDAFGRNEFHVRAHTINEMAIAQSAGHHCDNAATPVFQGYGMRFMRECLRVVHLNVAQTHDSWGFAYARTGEYRKAITHLRTALSIKVTNLGMYHPFLLDTSESLGEIHSILGQFRTALSYFEHTFTICEALCGRNHPRTAQIMENLARTYSNMGLYEAALTLYHTVRAIKEVHLGPSNIKTADTINNMGVTYQALHQYDRALESFELALHVYQRHEIDGNDVRMANTLNNLGVVCSQQGHYPKAQEFLEQALQVKEAMFGVDNLVNVDTINNLGIVYSGMGEVQKALFQYKHAMSITKRLRGEWHVDLGDMYNNIGVAYLSLGHVQLARDNLEQSCQIFVSYLGASHPKSVKSERLLRSVLSQEPRVKKGRKRVHKLSNRRR
jgi:tetratricopeptide (TPR) repeat protein